MSNTIVGTIIIPVLNEAQRIDATLTALLHQNLDDWKIVVVDGGSVDSTRNRAEKFPITFMSGPKGRAVQMNLGAKNAEGEVLLFLHGDTILPDELNEKMTCFIQSSRLWGRFDVRLDSSNALLKMVSWFINKRSKFSGIATGDQAIFAKRDFFIQVNGFPEIALMEDIAFCKKAKQHSRPYCVTQPAITSSRRWQKKGVFKTIALMWWFRFAYFIGVSPQRLHSWYYPNIND